MGHDPEIVAMNKVYNVFRNLDNGKRKRIIHWLIDRFGLMGDKPLHELTHPIQKQTETKPMKKEKQEKAVKPLEKRGVKQYDTVLDLFSEAKIKKSTGKILLMAAYLQERHNFKEITTYDINFRLKRIKHGVTNISSLINGILKRKPQLLDEIKKEGQTKHARRKFRVTEEGLKVVKNYL